MKTVLLQELTWTEVADMRDQLKAIIIPVGSIEQHGPHLPLEADIAFTFYVAKKAAENAYPKVLVAPPLSVGVSQHHLERAGTLSLREETFINLLLDICYSLKHHGINKIIILNGHGGNRYSLYIAARRAKDELGLSVVATEYWSFIPQKVTESNVETARIDSSFSVGHACEAETSMGLYIFPDKVRKNAIRKEEIELSPKQRLMLPYLRGHIIYPGFDVELSKTGVKPFGDPTIASFEKGKNLIEAAVKGFTEFLEDFTS